MGKELQAIKRELVGRGNVNEYGLTPKQEAFAQHVASGESLSDAYRMAFNVTTTRYQTINVAASKLAGQEKVKHRVGMLLREQEKALHRDALYIRKHVFSGLLRESMNDEATSSERTKALIALGKIDIVGMFSEKKADDGRKENRKSSEIEAELKEKLRAFLIG